MFSERHKYTIVVIRAGEQKLSNRSHLKKNEEEVNIAMKITYENIL